MTVSELDGTVVTAEILLVYNVLGEIILKSINYKYNLLVGKEELGVEVFITWVLNTDEIREPYCLEVKVKTKDSKRGRTKDTKKGNINSNNRREDILGGGVEDNSGRRDKDNEETSDEASPYNACGHALVTQIYSSKYSLQKI